MFSRFYNLAPNFNYFKRAVKVFNLVLSVGQFLEPMIILSTVDTDLTVQILTSLRQRLSENLFCNAIILNLIKQMIIELNERCILKLIKVPSHCKVFLEISVQEILKTMKNCSYST